MGEDTSIMVKRKEILKQKNAVIPEWHFFKMIHNLIELSCCRWHYFLNEIMKIEFDFGEIRSLNSKEVITRFREIGYDNLDDTQKFLKDVCENYDIQFVGSYEETLENKLKDKGYEFIDDIAKDFYKKLKRNK